MAGIKQMEFTFTLKVSLFALAVSICNAGPLYKDHKLHKRSDDSQVEFHIQNRDTLVKEFESQVASNAGQQMSSDSMFGYPHDCVNVMEGENVPLYKRSTCPWVYVEDRNATRFPVVIFKAQLRCGSSCLGDNGSRNVCAAVKQSTTMLYTDLNGGSEYVEKTEEVTVGWTCAGPKSAESGSGDSGQSGSNPDDGIF